MQSNVKNVARAGVIGQEEASFSPSLCSCGDGRGQGVTERILEPKCVGFYPAPPAISRVH